MSEVLAVRSESVPSARSARRESVSFIVCLLRLIIGMIEVQTAYGRLVGRALVLSSFLIICTFHSRIT